MTKHIIIGGTGGIGAAIARRLPAAGHSLHLIARDEAKLAPLAAELNASFSVADVQDRAALEAAILGARSCLFPYASDLITTPLGERAQIGLLPGTGLIRC